MLCPDELVVLLNRKQSGNAKSFRLCMTKGFFYSSGALTGRKTAWIKTMLEKEAQT